MYYKIKYKHSIGRNVTRLYSNPLELNKQSNTKANYISNNNNNGNKTKNTLDLAINNGNGIEGKKMIVTYLYIKKRARESELM